MKFRILTWILAAAFALSTPMSIGAHADSLSDNKEAVMNRDDVDETGTMLKTSRTIKGIKYTLTIDLSKWEGYTDLHQIDHIEELFYDVYPNMYDRFGDYTDAPTDVVIIIENEGYSVAKAKWIDNRIHIHDQYLYKNYDHYDCLTHELCHIVQHQLKNRKEEFPEYYEVFADYCRYIYAYKDGRYNDYHWELKDANGQSTREKSVRFLVWLDYETSSSNRDIMRDLLEITCDGKYEGAEWSEAWKKLFKGTKFEGKTIDEVWEKYLNSDFAYYSSLAPDKDSKSELLKINDVRSYIKKHSYSYSYDKSH